jgi:hypothetical protein
MPDGSKARAALAPLAKLVGQWEGDARVQTGPDASTVVRQHEDVVFGAASTLLIIRGTGRSSDPAAKGSIVFEAAATVWFDTESNQLKMRAHRSDGMAVEPDIEVRPDTLIWAFPVPGGRIRYTIAYSDTEWHEVGHYLRDGVPPIQTIEMRLKKTTK